MLSKILSKIFQLSSTSSEIYSSSWKLAWNYFKTIPQAYCSPWIFSNMFIIGEI